MNSLKHALVSTALLAAAAVSVTPAAAQDLEQGDWTIRADKIYTAAGKVIDGGSVVTSGGKIRAVTPGGGKGGKNGGKGKVLSAAAVTPGMVDLSIRITSGDTSVEQSREVSPELRALDGIDAFDRDWLAQARTGVTSALANPPDMNVIGGLGAVIKTAGSSDVGERLVKADAVLRGSFGGQPSARNHPAFGRPTDFFSRRPTTRMGVEWEHRKAFYDAAAARKDPETRGFQGRDQLVAVLEGRRPFMVQTWATQDIRTAIYLKEEIEAEGLGKPIFILDAAAEAWREPEMLARSGASVVLPPYPERGRAPQDGAFMTLGLAEQLHQLGVPFALSAHGSRSPGESLGHQAGFAMRGGLPFEAALEAVTMAPARMVGVDDRVGSIEVGKDADLVLWSGTPFEATSSVIGVVVDGYLVLDPRDRE